MIKTATLITSLAIATLIPAPHLHAAGPDENVVIISGVEEFRFINSPDGPEVKHSVTHEYQATRRAEIIQPHIFHSNIVTLDKASGGKAQYRNANSPTVFHDDSKVCYFDINLDRKDKKAKVQFKRTFTDGAHFTGIFPEEDYPIRSKRIVFEIPASLPGIELIDRNFPASGISREEHCGTDGSRTVTYTLTSLPEIPDDDCQPSSLSSRPHIMVRGYFPDTDSLYRYHAPMLEVDTAIPGVTSMIAGITKGTADRTETISRLYRHVQQNIRYVAFEAGEAAYRPDTPAEVLRKRYGDCKGMSLLLTTLLNRAGIEAHVAAVGTTDIPFRIAEAPSLAATNHMICIVPDGDGYLFLDPTHSLVSSRHIPEWLRSKDAMMFTPGGYRLVSIPAESPESSEDVLTYDYQLTTGGLAGQATRVYTEDVAEIYNSKFSEIPGQHVNELLVKTLIPSSRASIPADSISIDSSTPGRISVSAPIVNRSAVTAADGYLYIDLNTSGDPMTSRIDTDRRKSDYGLPMKARVIRRSSVSLPPGLKVTLPDNYSVSLPQADLSCTFAREGDTVSMTKVMDVKSTRIPLAGIPAWNKALKEWNDACNLQIEIRLE